MSSSILPLVSRPLACCPSLYTHPALPALLLSAKLVGFAEEWNLLLALKFSQTSRGDQLKWLLATQLEKLCNGRKIRRKQVTLPWTSAPAHGAGPLSGSEAG